jgi:hypothetical protein
MYKTPDYDYQQICFVNFNATCGMQLDRDNGWIKNSHRLPWQTWEVIYRDLFPSETGNVAKPARMVIGSLIIQLRMGFTDRDLVQQIRENPYYQYFIGLEAFQHDAPFAPSVLVDWRKRLGLDLVVKLNDILCDTMPKLVNPRNRYGSPNQGTLITTQICDATVAPQNIRYPQDTSLLNEARTKCEQMIDWFCKTYDLSKPRTYRKIAHKEYLAFAKSKKPSKQLIRNTIKKQLSYVRRDLKYLDEFMGGQGYAPAKKFVNNIITIHILYDQQKYMYDNDTHKVDGRIVSISQPYVRPVMRGKASKPTEFGAKLHLSVDERGFARIEYLSFDAYNEGIILQEALEAYKARNGFYPERVLVDQIYRTRANRAFCKKNNIRISGPKLGAPSKDKTRKKADEKQAAIDNADRIEIERYFSIAKRRNGMGLITKKRKDTSLSTIAMSVLVTNIFGSFKSAVAEHEERTNAASGSRSKRRVS